MKNFTNSPILLAQEACKESVIKVANEVRLMYEAAVVEGAIKDYEVNMEPWNNGYELTITPEFDFSTVIEERMYFNRFRISIQPSTFFNRDYSKNEASFEIGISFGVWKFLNVRQEVRGEIKIDNRKILSDILNLKKL